MEERTDSRTQLRNGMPTKNANEALVIRTTGGSRFAQKVNLL